MSNVPGATPVDPAQLGLGAAFNPLTPGNYSWERMDLMAQMEQDGPMQQLTVFILIWDGPNGRHVCNLIGEDDMRTFIRHAQERLTGLVLPSF